MKWIKRIALGFAILLVVLAIVVFVGEAMFHNSGKQELAEVSARIDAEEPGWRLAEMEAARQAAAPKDDANSAPVVLALQAALPKNWLTEEPLSGAITNQTPSFLQTIWVLQVRESTAKVREEAREQLLQPALVKQSGGYYPVTIPDNPISTLLPHVQKTREVVALLSHDARISALEGKPGQGIRASRAGLVAAKSIGDEPFLISQLVRIACDEVAVHSAMQVLAWGQPKQGLAELQAELRTEADFPWFLIGLRGERATLDKTFQGLEAGTIPLSDFLNLIEGHGQEGHGAVAAAGFKLYRGFISGDHAKALETITAYVAAAKLPPQQQLAAVKAIPIPPGPPESYRFLLTRMLIPACEKLANAGIRTRAHLLAGSTAIACERFRIANKRWPNSLDEIPRTILPEVPVDPYDGLPLRYRKLADGVAVYSIGDGDERSKEQRRDNCDPLAEIGFGWKLWNPELRGIPMEYKTLP